MAKKQDRFWEVMDLHGQRHVVCASHYHLVGAGIEFLSHTGQVDVDDGFGLARTVAAFSGFIYFKDIADAAQAGEDARESDNLEAQVAAAVAELTQEARQGPETGSIEARLARVEAAMHRVGAHQFTGRQMAAPPRRRGFFRFLPGWVSRDYGRGGA